MLRSRGGLPPRLPPPRPPAGGPSASGAVEARRVRPFRGKVCLRGEVLESPSWGQFSVQAGKARHLPLATRQPTVAFRRSARQDALGAGLPSLGGRCVGSSVLEASYKTHRDRVKAGLQAPPCLLVLFTVRLIIIIMLICMMIVIDMFARIGVILSYMRIGT